MHLNTCRKNWKGRGIFTGTGKYWLGVTTITYTYKDTLGNQVTCPFTVTIEAKPEIECQYLSGPFDANDNCEYPFNPDVPDLISGGQPIDWTWTMYYPDLSMVVGTGSSRTPDDGPILYLLWKHRLIYTIFSWELPP